MNRNLTTKSFNNRIVILLMILGLSVFFISGCQQGVDQAKTATNTAPNTTANSATTNTAANNPATNTATNSEVAKSNTNTEAANNSPVAPPKPDNCNGPADNEVIVYEDVFSDNGGGGKCVKLKPGEYKNAAEMGFPNDNMSSIKVGINVRATVCDNENFTAPCEEFEKTDYNLMDNPTIKNDTASSVKIVEVKTESKPEAVKALSNGLAGDWISVDGKETAKFTEDKFEAKSVGQEKPYVIAPYKVVDGKMVEITVGSNPIKAIMTFEDNGNTLVFYRPDNGGSIKYNRPKG